MGLFERFPYTNFHELNADWIISEVKRLAEEWKTYNADWEQWKNDTNAAFQSLHDYVMNYFNNLDIDQEVLDKVEIVINNYKEDGQLESIISPYIPTLVSSWLEENVDPSTVPVVDKSLSIANAAADAQITGYGIRNIIRTQRSFKPIFVYGTISGTDGQITANATSDRSQTATNRARSVGFIKNLSRLINPNGYKFNIFFYAEDDTYISNLGQSTETDIIIPWPPAAAKCKILFLKDQTPLITIEEILNNVIFLGDPAGYLAKGTTIDSASGYIVERVSGGTLQTRFMIPFYLTPDDTLVIDEEAPKLINKGEYSNNLDFISITGFISIQGALDINSGLNAVFGDTNINYVIKDKVEELKAFNYKGEKINLNNTYNLNKTPVVSSSNEQDGAIYEDYLIRFTSTGIIRVYNIITGEIIYTANITGDIPHANAVFLGNKYDETDPFPVVYANRYNNSPLNRGVLYAYRLIITDNILTAELIQTINLGFTEDSIWTTGADQRPYGNFINDNGTLWAYTTLDGDVNKTRFFNLGNLPGFTESTVVINKEDIVDYFDTDKQPYPQAAEAHAGKAYCTNEWQGDLTVVDLIQKSTITKIDFRDTPAAGEPELIAYSKKLNKLIYAATANAYILEV